ncbi:hypothetical protein GIB67_001236, partial [Kingdonia uniflora]
YYSYPQYPQPHYPYYQLDYTHAYQSQPQAQPVPIESTQILPPGVSAPPEPVPHSQPQPQPQPQQQPNVYYPQGPPAAGVAGEQQQQHPPNFPVPTGLNPAAAAAVAALSQLTQFAGKMDAAERAMAGIQEQGQWQGNNGGYGPGMMPQHGGYHQGPFPSRGMKPTCPDSDNISFFGIKFGILFKIEDHEGGNESGSLRDQMGPLTLPIFKIEDHEGGNESGSLRDQMELITLPAGRSPYRGGGGGRRGGGSFRGGGRGNFGQRQPRSDGSSPNFRGRGRERACGRRFPQHDLHQGTVQGEVPASESEALAADQGDALQTGSAAPAIQGRIRKPTQSAWCELCRVDCTTLEILEQHKNGKKHKKNFQRFEELQSVNKPLPVMTVAMAAPVYGSTIVPVSTSEPLSMPEVLNVQKPAPESQSEEPISIPEVKDEQTGAPESQSEPPISMPNVENEPKSPIESQLEVVPVTEKVVESEQNTPECPKNLCTDATIEENKTETDVNIEENKMETDATIEENKTETDVSIEESKAEIDAIIEESKTETDATIEENKMEADAQNSGVEQQAELTQMDSRKRNFDRFNTRGRGRFNTRGRGRGANKRMRTFERPPPRQLPPPKVVVPMICDLCNVTCDTQAVFECHLAGKKHISKVKRFHGHQAMYGPVGLQALYPPNPNVQPIYVPQVQYHQPQYHQPQYQQPAMYSPQGSYLPYQAHQTAAFNFPQQAQQSFGSQEAQVTLNGNQSDIAVAEPVSHQAAIGVDREVRQAETSSILQSVGMSDAPLVMNPMPPPRENKVAESHNSVQE